MMQQRHSWGEPVRFANKTERECLNCGIVKVTRHEATCWTEFWRGLDQIEGTSTPVCESIMETT
jgi:hypothetical protein